MALVKGSNLQLLQLMDTGDSAELKKGPWDGFHPGVSIYLRTDLVPGDQAIMQDLTTSTRGEKSSGVEQLAWAVQLRVSTDDGSCWKSLEV